MDGYKKFISLGCAILIVGYFLPWFVAQMTVVNGFDILKESYETVRQMINFDAYDTSTLLLVGAVALPAFGGVFSLLYNFLKPARGNGGFGTFFYVIPFITLLAIYAYIFYEYSRNDVTAMAIQQIGDELLKGLFNLQKTAGLWMVHIGAVFMMLGRMARGSNPTR